MASWALAAGVGCTSTGAFRTASMVSSFRVLAGGFGGADVGGSLVGAGVGVGVGVGVGKAVGAVDGGEVASVDGGVVPLRPSPTTTTGPGS
jgi:hypothetical protein